MTTEPTISDAALREHIARHLSRVIAYAETAITMLDIGDDKGSGYAIRKGVAHMGHAGETWQTLHERVMQQAKEEHYALQRPAKPSQPDPRQGSSNRRSGSASPDARGDVLRRAGQDGVVNADRA